jgi:FecR-like protein
MRRREFIVLFSSTAATLSAVWPFSIAAQDRAPPVQTPSDQPAPQAVDESVGQVASLAGTATVKRGDAAAVVLKVTDHIFVNDTLRTAVDSSLGVTFDDETTFSLSSNTMIVVDKFLYEPDGKDNAASIHVGVGTAAFVASFVAKTGDLTITMDAASIGIRGTTGVIEVPEAGATPTVAPTVKLYPDADGHVGRIEVSDYNGARLGTLTAGASALSLRSAGGGRFTAVQFQISAAEIARDRGVLQRLTTSHEIGRLMATQRRQLRGPNGLGPNNNRGGRGGQNNEGGKNNLGGKGNDKGNNLGGKGNGKNDQPKFRRGQGGLQQQLNTPKVGTSPTRVAPRFNLSIPKLKL